MSTETIFRALGVMLIITDACLSFMCVALGITLSLYAVLLLLELKRKVKP